MDPMVDKLLRVCCSDDAKANVTASSIKADLEEQARKAMMALRGRRESSVCEYTGPRTIVAMGKKISVAQVWCSSMECSRPTLTRTPNPNPNPNPNPTTSPSPSPNQVLQYVQSPKGPLNWVLIDSSMKLIEAGGGSVAEMSQFFDPKEVQRRSPSG